MAGDLAGDATEQRLHSTSESGIEIADNNTPNKPGALSPQMTSGASNVDTTQAFSTGPGAGMAAANVDNMSEEQYRTHSGLPGTQERGPSETLMAAIPKANSS